MKITESATENRLKTLFERKQKNILNIYFTAGHPQLEDTAKIIIALEKSGVDLVEVGMPYSDPLADGPTIQNSGAIALKNGMTLDLLFQQLKRVRQTSNIPMILMGYYNQVIQYGEIAFFDRCQEIGVDGLILPDLPIEIYERDYKHLFEARNLRSTFLITPQTNVERIRKINALSSGFVYMVSSSSITGAKKGISEKQIAYFNKIKALSLDKPRLIGFGISDRETFSTACRFANGAIVGSAFIRLLENNLKDEVGEERQLNIEKIIKDFVAELKP